MEEDDDNDDAVDDDDELSLLTQYSRGVENKGVEGNVCV